jgi:nucleotide-binding universal stress UspA family protein
MIKNILTAVDGSTNSNRALELACNLAIKYDASLTILHVVPNVLGTQALVVGSSAVVIEPDLSDLEATARVITENALTKARKAGCESASIATETGSPSKEIIDYAKRNHSDMIVMGSRGLSDIAGLFLGSVSHKVNHLSGCSCITVH